MVGKTKTAKRSQRKKKGSKYIGVYQTNAVKPTWEAKIKHGGKLVYGGGAFPTQAQAAKRVNSMCRKFNISEKNPGLLNEEESDILKLFLKKLERYVPKVGDKIQAIQPLVTQTKPKRDVRVNKIMVVQKIDEDGDILVSNTEWSKRSWISKKDFGKIKIADECTKPMVGEKDKVKKNRRKKIPSEYIGVHQNNTLKPTWSARIKHNDDLFYGGAFPTQEQTAKRVNTMCRKFNIEPKNPGLLNEDEADIPKRFKLEHTSVTKTIKKVKRTRKKKVKSSTKMSEVKITENTPLPTTKPVNKTMREQIEESSERYRSMISIINSKHGSLEKYITKINKLHHKNKPQRPKKVRTYVPCPGYVFVIVKRKYWSLPVRGEVIIRSKTIILPTVFKSKEAAEEDIEKREDKIEKNLWDDEIPSNPAWYDQTTKFFIQKVKE